jgi:IclR family transcriptional regulator, pca regulon regulatory protein
MSLAISSDLGTQSLERGLAVLAAFSSSRPALGITELANQLRFSRSTTHRYVATLTSLGYLEQDNATRKYRLAPRVLDLGFSALGSLDLRETAAPYLRGLTERTGYTSGLAVRTAIDVVLIARIRGRRDRHQPVQATLHLGSRAPAHCSAPGRVLLAYQREVDINRLLNRVACPSLRPRPYVDLAALRAELERVRSAGVAFSDDHYGGRLRAVAVPVWSRSGEVVAALTVAIPVPSASMSELARTYAPLLAETAHEIGLRVV